MIVLLRYARVAGVWVDVLIDDELDLPVRLPSPQRHEGVPRKAARSTRKRWSSRLPCVLLFAAFGNFICL